MRGIVTHFLRLEVLNLHPMVYWGLAGVWLLLLLAAIASVRSLKISTAAKIVWLSLILALPILGLAIYALRCLACAKWEVLKPWFQSRRVDQELATAGTSADPSAKA